MKINNTKFKLSLLASALYLTTNVSALDLIQNGKTIVFDSLDNTQYSLTLRSPDGKTQSFKVVDGGFTLTPEMLGVDVLDNGLYKYEMTEMTNVGSLSNQVRELNNKAASTEYIKSFKSNKQPTSGVFTIHNDLLVDKTLTDSTITSVYKTGTIDIASTNTNYKSSGSSAIVDMDVPPTTRDQVILDDLIVDGSICVGMDCVNGESFGFDTLRLKENNLRIRAVDTSSTASFPSRDWQITFNDSANGGANKFSIDDIDGGRTPFTIEGNAPSHSLYVDDGGRLGLGTSTPVVDIHVKSGNTPTLRLEQDGSSGFGPQTWDVAGNEANFFIRDATNGSTLPFRIFPGAPSDALDIAASGNVGIGTASPTSHLHVNESTVDTAVKITLGNSSNNTSWEWVHRAHVDQALAINNPGNPGAEFILSPEGNLKISGTLITQGTTCSNGATASAGCDLVFSESYKLPTIEEHAFSMWENSYLPNVGPTYENMPFNLTEKTGGILNELEKAHIYIEQLNKRLKTKEQKIEAFENQFSLLEKRLSKLEIK